jgi:integrase
MIIHPEEEERRQEMLYQEFKQEFIKQDVSKSQLLNLKGINRSSFDGKYIRKRLKEEDVEEIKRSQGIKNRTPNRVNTRELKDKLNDLPEEDLHLLYDFQNERGITHHTLDGYKNSVKLFNDFTKRTLHQMLINAEEEEELGIRWKKSELKKTLIGFRNYLNEIYAYNTVLLHFNRIKAIYAHHEIEIGKLPQFNKKGAKLSEPINYDDLPDVELIKKAYECTPHYIMKAIILFMSSSGCARRETLNLTIGDFMDATKEYHEADNIYDCVIQIIRRNDVIPTFRLMRQKTNKYYFTFCSPEAVVAICNYLIHDRFVGRRPKHGEKLFQINLDYWNNYFAQVNNVLELGKINNYNVFRSHMLRKFHASRLYNDGLSMDKIDALQGRSKDNTHNAYFKESPEKLKEIYMEHMDCIRVRIW